MITKDDFDQLQVNFDQAPEGFIAIHAYKKGKGCRYFEVPYEWIDYDNFFDKVLERANVAWQKIPIDNAGKCNVCTHGFLSFHWLYKGKYFCRFCGTHYDRDGRFTIVTRSILENR